MTGVECITYLKYYGIKKIYGKNIADLRILVLRQHMFLNKPAIEHALPPTPADVAADAALSAALAAPAAPAVAVPAEPAAIQGVDSYIQSLLTKITLLTEERDEAVRECKAGHKALALAHKIVHIVSEYQ